MARRFLLLPGLALACTSSGCGTFMNVTAESTTPGGYRAFGPSNCEPFGGVQRSILAGSAPIMAGPIGYVPAIVMVGVDAPLSLAGDIVTLPYVYHRLNTETRLDPPTNDPRREPSESKRSSLPNRPTLPPSPLPSEIP